MRRVELVLVAMLAVAGCFAASDAWAHRGGGPNDPCERRLGNALVHLTLYQPDYDPDAEYCNEVPREGKTVVVVDFQGDQLRESPIAIDVIASDDSGQRQVFDAPARVYRRGVSDNVVSLDYGSAYVVRVAIHDPSNRAPVALSFPIRVGAWYRPIVVPALMVVALLVLTAIPIARYYYFGAGSESDRDDHSAAA